MYECIHDYFTHQLLSAFMNAFMTALLSVTLVRQEGSFSSWLVLLINI